MEIKWQGFHLRQRGKRGQCKELADNAIHIPLNNMQIAEDFQMMIGHILMKDLKGRK
jgi:D-sedoheptulose 7-phosphate isomerase